MGFSCSCPSSSSLPDLNLSDCKENFGQIQKIIFMRTRSISDNEVIKFPNMTELTQIDNMLKYLTSESDDKIVVSPYVQNPVSEPGEAITYGGGNQTRDGIEVIIGREASRFTCILYQESQLTVKQLKAFSCERHLGVILIDENGHLILEKSGSEYMPIPITNFMVQDKKLGGLEEPDSNTVSWTFLPNWSDNVVSLTPENYNPLTDLVIHGTEKEILIPSQDIREKYALESYEVQNFTTQKSSSFMRVDPESISLYASASESSAPLYLAIMRFAGKNMADLIDFSISSNAIALSDSLELAKYENFKRYKGPNPGENQTLEMIVLTTVNSPDEWEMFGGYVFFNCGVYKTSASDAADTTVVNTGGAMTTYTPSLLITLKS